MPLTRDQSEEIRLIVNVAIKQMWMDEGFIKTIADKVSVEISKRVNKKLQLLETEVNILKEDVKQLKTEQRNAKVSLDAEIDSLKGENGKLFNKCDYLEQETKRGNIRLFNLEEKSNENTIQEVILLLNSKLPVNITTNDVEACYRVGKLKDNKSRGIFMKFKNHQIKQEIMVHKKQLKGSGVVIRENLTWYRINLMNEAIRKTSLKSVWTESGKIRARVDNKIIAINSPEDLKHLG